MLHSRSPLMDSFRNPTPGLIEIVMKEVPNCSSLLSDFDSDC
jgi:hypothetical protein